MPLLLYCMTEAIPSLEPGCAGLRDAAIESIETGGLRCFYSQLDYLPVPSADVLRTDAAQFHRVIQGLLRHAAVVPFRFPTLMETEAKLRKYLAANAEAYRRELHRFAGLVQMEIRICSTAAPAESGAGTEHKRVRQDHGRALAAHATVARDAARGLIQDWQVRDEDRDVYCYALVRRDQVEGFEDRMRSLSPLEGATMMVSGPWPPTRFLHVSHR